MGVVMLLLCARVGTYRLLLIRTCVLVPCVRFVVDCVWLWSCERYRDGFVSLLVLARSSRGHRLGDLRFAGLIRRLSSV